MIYIIGIDISKHQGKVEDEELLKKAAFVYIRATIGFNKDPRFEYYKEICERLGIPWGAYHAVSATTYVGAQIQRFISHVDGNWGQMPPMIDLELKGVGLGFVKEWIIMVQEASGVQKLMLYTRMYYFDELKDTKNIKQFIFENCYLFVAHYTDKPEKISNIRTLNVPLVPVPWRDQTDPLKRWTIWQYSADGNGMGAAYGLESHSLDLDRINGGEATLHELTGGFPHEDPEPPAPMSRVRITASFYRLRPEPKYIKGIKTMIVENGQVLEKNGPIEIEQLSDGPINWQPVKFPPEYGGGQGYISLNYSYVEELP